MRKLFYIFSALALILSLYASYAVGYNYRDMLCGIEHGGYSAPAEIAFLLAIPSFICIIICLGLAFFFYKKSK